MLRGRVLDILLAGVCLSSLLLSCVADFGAHGEIQFVGVRLGDACIFHRFTHLDCPFCGMSRSMISLFHGQYSSSFLYHPLGPCLAVGFLCFSVAVCVAACRGSAPIIETRVFSFLILAVVIASVSLWGVRGFATCRLGHESVNMEVQ